MRCSRCSEQLRPVVAVDIDGTLANYHDHLARFVAHYFNCPQYLGWDGEGEFEDHLHVTKQQYREAKLAFRQGGMKRTMPVYPGARYLMGQLRKHKAEVWIATTRPWLRLDNVDPDTREWLRRCDISFDGLLYDEDKYGQLCERVDRERIVGVLEDLPEQFDRAEELGLSPIQRENIHNRAPSQRRSPCANLWAAGDLLAGRIAAWYERYEEIHV